MRLRLLSFIVLLLAIVTIVARPGLAATAAEPAKSTIRIVSAPALAPAPAPVPTPALAPAPAALRETPEPHELAVPQAQPEPPLEPVSESQLEQPDIVSIRFLTAEPSQRSAAQYPVRQAVHAAASAAPTPARAPTTGRVSSVVNPYSSANARSTLAKMPRPMSVQPSPKAPAPQGRGKPFQSVPSEPTISPYLNLYRRDVDANNLPNYFAFVRPQLEQQEANRQQAAELQKLRGQLQNVTSGGAPRNSPNMTAHARYMDTAQFYGGMNR